MVIFQNSVFITQIPFHLIFQSMKLNLLLGRKKTLHEEFSGNITFNDSNDLEDLW